MRTVDSAVVVAQAAAMMQHSRPGSAGSMSTDTETGPRSTQLRVDAKTFQPRQSEDITGLQGLPKVHVRRPTLVNLDTVPFTPSQGIATPSPMSGVWYNNLALYADPGSAGRAGIYYWPAHQPMEMSTADSGSTRSDGTRFQSDSDRSPSHTYSPVWTFAPQFPGQGGEPAQMSGDPTQTVGFVYGPPAVPFASYANFQGALYPMFHATPPQTAHPHAGSPHAHAPGMPFPQGFIPVSPMSHRHFVPDSGSPQSPRLVYAPPFMMGGSPDQMRGARAGSWGAHAAAPPPGNMHGQPRMQRRSSLGPRQYPSGPEGSRHSSPVRGEARASSPEHRGPPAAHSYATPPQQQQLPVLRHQHGPSPARQLQHSTPLQEQQQTPAQDSMEDSPAQLSPDMLGPDGQPLKLNARQRRTLRRAAARAAAAAVGDSGELQPEASVMSESGSPLMSPEPLDQSCSKFAASPESQISGQAGAASAMSVASTPPESVSQSDAGSRTAHTPPSLIASSKPELNSVESTVQGIINIALHNGAQQQQQDKLPLPQPIVLSGHKAAPQISIQATATTGMSPAPKPQFGSFDASES